MKIALVELASIDPLNIYSLIGMHRGIPLLAAILEKSGHIVNCFVETIQKFEWSELTHYDVVGFSIISCTAEPTYTMVRKLRGAGYQRLILVGGPHATVLPEESLAAGADVVVRHEGDKTLPQLIGAVEKGKSLDGVLGITWKKEGNIRHNPDQVFLAEAELSVLPLPSFRSIVGFQRMRHISLSFSRGCPRACDFCAVEAMFGPKYRFTTRDWRISQLKALRDEYPELWKNCSIFVTDDNSFGSHSGKLITIETLEQMIAEDLVPPKGWFCQMLVADATSEVVELMKRAGCTMVCLGIESVNEDTLKALRKNQTPDEIEEGLKNLHKAGINTLAMTIAGTDTDTFWSFFRGIRQLAKWGITYLQIVIMVPLVGTKLALRLEAEGRGIHQISKRGITFLQIVARVPLVGTKIARWLETKGRGPFANFNLHNGMHVVIKPKKMSKIGVWMALYLVTFWFYFISVNGRRLIRKHFRDYMRMVRITFLQGLKCTWQTIKERFTSYHY